MMMATASTHTSIHTPTSMTVSEESDSRLTFGLYVKHGGGITRSAPMDSRRGCGRVVYYNWHHHIKVHQARKL